MVVRHKDNFFKVTIFNILKYLMYIAYDALSVVVFNGFTTRPRGEMRKPIDNTQSMEYMETLVGFSQSVGKICIHAYPPCTGTGFRVGKRYVMTAYHVVQAHIPGNILLNVSSLISVLLLVISLDANNCV